MQSKLVASDEVTGRAFVDAFAEVPVVLMSEGGATDDVMCAVRLGAVDFLDKPLSHLKLKNIWQHSVRRMMQRTTLYDASPAYSEPAPIMAHHHQQSLSDCLPSSMTAPMGLMNHPPPPPPPQPPLIRRSYEKQPSPTSVVTVTAPHRCSVDSPGTPSAGDCEPAESMSGGSVHQLNNSGNNDISSAFFTNQELTDVTGGACIEVDGGVGGAGATGVGGATATVFSQTTRSHSVSTHQQPMPMPMHVSSIHRSSTMPPTSFSMGSHWPQLPTGCVWGTPRGGPLPPPFPSPPTTTTASMTPTPTTSVLRVSSVPVVVLKSHHAAQQQQQSPCLSFCTTTTSDSAVIAVAIATTATENVLPEGFLSLTKAKEEAATRKSGPIGLRLRKSESLLDLINASLKTGSGAGEGDGCC